MNTINLETIYKKKEGLLEKEIEDELVIITIDDDISDIDSTIYTLNETGKMIWNTIDGKKSLKEIIRSAGQEYNVSEAQLEKELIQLICEFLTKKLIYEYS